MYNNIFDNDDNLQKFSRLNAKDMLEKLDNNILHFNNGTFKNLVENIFNKVLLPYFVGKGKDFDFANANCLFSLKDTNDFGMYTQELTILVKSLDINLVNDPKKHYSIFSITIFNDGKTNLDCQDVNFDNIDLLLSLTTWLQWFTNNC